MTLWRLTTVVGSRHLLRPVLVTSRRCSQPNDAPWRERWEQPLHRSRGGKVRFLTRMKAESLLEDKVSSNLPIAVG